MRLITQRRVHNPNGVTPAAAVRPANDNALAAATTHAEVSPGSVASRYLHDPGTIERVFRMFRDSGARVQLRFAGADTEFAACVLEVTHAQFLLDDIRPRTGLRMLRDRQRFSLAGRAEGIYTLVNDLRVAEISVDRGVPCFVVPLPTEMLYQQRRRAVRYRLPQSTTRDRARITLNRSDRVLCGYLVDISAGGCRVVFDVDSDPQLQQGEVFERCEIDAPGRLQITTQSIVRHHSLNQQTGQLCCGIQFAEMDIDDRRRLKQFIAQIAKTANSA